MGGCNGTQSVAERSYPMSEVRGRSREDSMLEGRRPRGATLQLRTEVVAENARLQQRRSRGGGWEKQPNIQGAVAASAPEGLEELFHVQGQQGQQ